MCVRVRMCVGEYTHPHRVSRGQRLTSGVFLYYSAPFLYFIYRVRHMCTCMQDASRNGQGPMFQMFAIYTVFFLFVLFFWCYVCVCMREYAQQGQTDGTQLPF